jgi:ABC-2 type transport system ATP-binding protein
MLTLSRVRKRFGPVQALDGCSFSVERGRMLGFLGPNGAGKTTTMRAIFGLVELDAGDVLWDGRPIALEDRLRFGYMPEERGLYPRMPVGEQVAYFARLHGMAAADARASASRWLGRLGLADRAGAKLEELSHGNQQRAQLAAALLHEPELLVLDEPFAGLDPIAVQTLVDVLRGEAQRGAAVLFSSHQLELVEDICEDVAIVDQGRVVATGASSPRATSTSCGVSLSGGRFTSNSTARPRHGCRMSRASSSSTGTTATSGSRQRMTSIRNKCSQKQSRRGR